MTPAGLTVHVNHIEDARPITRNEVVCAVLTAAESDGLKAGEISVTFLDSSEIAALNEKYLGRKGSTDVIAFNLDEPAKPLGDVYICAEVARESAEEYGVELREELLRLIVHGVLHLIGYEHTEGGEPDSGGFFQRQETILSELV